MCHRKYFCYDDKENKIGMYLVVWEEDCKKYLGQNVWYSTEKPLYVCQTVS